jgi:hypothetical protein
MKQADIKHFVTNNPNVVSMKETSKSGLFVLKYKRKVFYDNLWNEYLEECRGTVVDADFNVIQRPFTKIYNYGVEARSPVVPDDKIVSAYRKINGFMAAISWYQDDILVSTTGSIDSDFVKYVYDLIDIERYRNVCKQYPNWTFMFECVHPDDPHIIPEVPGMYLLGYREKTWESVVSIDSILYSELLDQFNCFGCDSYIITMSGLMQIAKNAKHEGFVFYTKDGVSAKIKSPYYLIKKALARKQDILSLNKQIVAEEYYPLVDHLMSIRDNFNAMAEQERLQYIRDWLSKTYEWSV